MSTPEEVWAFWSGEPAADAVALEAKLRRWFPEGAALDDQIRSRFADTIERALQGDLDAEWSRTVRGRVALVVVLDQMVRHAYRGQPRCHAGHERALEIARGTIAAGLHRGLAVEERIVLCLPFSHSEDLDVQRTAVAESERLVADAPEALRPIAAMAVEQARKLHDVIARFGRFPFRNELLGRSSTPDERAFLDTWASQAPPARFADSRPG